MQDQNQSRVFSSTVTGIILSMIIAIYFKVKRNYNLILVYFNIQFSSLSFIKCSPTNNNVSNSTVLITNGI